MSKSYDRVSLVFLDGDDPCKYPDDPTKRSAWPAPIFSYQGPLTSQAPPIGPKMINYDLYRFRFLPDSPMGLRSRQGSNGWQRVVGVIAAVADAATDPMIERRIDELLDHVCSSIMLHCKDPWFEKTGFHMISIIAGANPTQAELSTRDRLVTTIESHLPLVRSQRLHYSEAWSPGELERVMKFHTRIMVDYVRLCYQSGKCR